MRMRLIELLACPECGAELSLEAWSRDTRQRTVPIVDAVACTAWCARQQCVPSAVTPAVCQACLSEEIVDGVLSCPRQHRFPVLGGIPRLLSEPMLRESLGERYAGFLARIGAGRATAMDSGETAARLATTRAFGYQWTTFSDNYHYFREIFESFVRPYLTREDFSGRLVLEVGCGSGRPATVAAGFGAEVVAVDLSIAVEAAYAMSQHVDGLHVVQGDAYRLPVQPRFDFAYSVGVLQHILDPAAALRGMARVLAPGQRLVLWVYGVREAWYQPVEWLRRFTRRMPYPLVRALSHGLAILSELLLLVPYRILSRVPPLRRLAERIPGRIYARLPYRENVLGWFDRLIAPVTYYFSERDLRVLLEEAGFESVQLYARPDASASWVVSCYRS